MHILYFTHLLFYIYIHFLFVPIKFKQKHFNHANQEEWQSES